ncbi:hypothetical protein Btru_077361 [Bulinus truncatus]|nr:hypothetical protein Btru_077361 [Bulinus truncatus]
MNISGFVATFFLACVIFPFLRAATITFDKLTPSASNNYTCGVIRCQHDLPPDALYVQEVEILRVTQTGTKMATTFAEEDNHVISEGVSLVNRSFQGLSSFVALDVQDPNLCGPGRFVCDVTYVGGDLSEKNAIATVQWEPLQESCLEGRQCGIVKAVTANIQPVNESVGSLIQSLNSGRPSDDQLVRPSWKLAFRGTSGIRKSVYLAYLDGTGIPAMVEDGCKQVEQPLPCQNHYRDSSVFNNWQSVSQVSFAVYKKFNKVKQVIFNATGSTYLNWFDQSRILGSSWTDLMSSTFNYFSIAGHQTGSIQRVFYMSHSYGTCATDDGWFVAIDNENGGCGYEKIPAFPAFKFASLAGKAVCAGASFQTADFFTIHVR